MKKQLVISAKNILKVYTLRHEKPTLIESLFYRSRNEKYNALEMINFSVFQGDRVGIIGKNGSGKTTLLKLLAGITKQKSGSLYVKGKVVSLISLEAGFHPDLSGEENIVLQGLVIGMSLKEIKQKKKAIIKFAEIGKFIDAPIYTYSSGMKLRLGFSIAIFANPEILLLDENFAVGDQKFREKIYDKFEELKKKKVTIIMVSHWLEELQKSCNKFLWLDKGKMIAYGGESVVKKYKKSFEK